jgi:competence protein ComEA
MPELSRSQVLVYGAVAIALLLVGARAIRAEGSGGAAPFSVTSAGADAGGSGIRIESGGSDLVVDVAGAVRRPGVYRLPAGARVVDAIERAGGPEGEALLEGINRAARLSDGQQVVVPLSGASGPLATVAAGEAGPISLGSATLEQLDTIEGIGPVTAQKIVEFRRQLGGLASVEQLDEVSGIGPATMESLRARLQP